MTDYLEHAVLPEFNTFDRLGVITPPFAMSIFIGSRLSGCSYAELLPIMLKFFFLVGIPVLLLTTYIPALSCWLPSVVLGPLVVGVW
ncbi:MAG: hypothetical protein LBQ42_10370 [Synergistaceae bacterium]|nr:hypothetical protein [Synergistaceae bacterium]